MRAFVIGTSPSCDVRVHDDEYVSSRHVRVVFDDDGQVWVEDLGSMNGTWIQRYGVPTPAVPYLLPRVADPTLMQPGDTLWLSRRTAIPWRRGVTVPRF